MNRRTFVLGVGVTFSTPVAARAQRRPGPARIGVLVAAGSTANPFADSLRQGLHELGYREGENVIIDWRYAEGRFERIPALMAELVSLRPDVIVAGAGLAGVRAAMEATATIPIVTPAIADPIASGVVKSLARPGGNVTGLSMLNTEISGKRLELLREAFPKTGRIGVLRNPGADPAQLRTTEAAGHALGFQLQIFDVRDPGEFDAVFERIRKARPDALTVLAASFFNAHRKRIVDVVARHRLPSIYEQREFVDAGGLMSYGPNLREMYRRAAVFVDKILKGAKPADLPVEQPTRFELVINLKTAKALRLTIAPSLLARADEVIQ